MYLDGFFHGLVVVQWRVAIDLVVTELKGDFDVEDLTRIFRFVGLG